MLPQSTLSFSLNPPSHAPSIHLSYRLDCRLIVIPQPTPCDALARQSTEREVHVSQNPRGGSVLDSSGCRVVYVLFAVCARVDDISIVLN